MIELEQAKNRYQLQIISHQIDAFNMNVLKELEVIKKDKNKEYFIKRYLLESCVKLSRFRSGESFSRNMKVARSFLKGVATKKQMHQAEWEIEGNAFSTEYYSEAGTSVYFRVNEDVRKDLIHVRISTGLKNKESKDYLKEMAYFINHAFCFIQYPGNWLFDEGAEKFLCPRLFKRYFG